MSGRQSPAPLTRGVLLAAFGAAGIFPVYMIGIESLKTAEEDRLGNPFVVLQPTLKWYLGLSDPAHWLHREIFVRRWPVGVWLENTAVVFAAALVVILAVSLMAAYALARLHPPGWRVWRGVLLGGYLIPQALLFLPMYDLVFRLHLADNPLALVLVYPTLAVPFCVWLFSAFLKRLPPEVEESAYLDGAGRLRTYLEIVLPMSWPVVAAAGVFALNVVSSDFMFASVFLPNQFHQTLTAGVGAMDVSMQDLAVVAGVNLAALSVVPVVAIFAWAYVRGLTAALADRS